MSIESIRYDGRYLDLTKEWNLISIQGRDAQAFLQGQLTNDVLRLNVDDSQLTARLTINGRVQFFFFLAKKNDLYFILCSNLITDALVDNLNKYIIMEDVELDIRRDLTLRLFLGPTIKKQLGEVLDKNCYFNINFAGESGILCWQDDIKHNILVMTSCEFEQIKFLFGWPELDVISQNALINETRLNDLAISYSKGCFLGQETAAKIQSRRGAAYFPVLLEVNEFVGNTLLDNVIDKKISIDSKDVGRITGQMKFEGKLYLKLKLIRDFRVNQKFIQLMVDNIQVAGRVLYFPFFEKNSSVDKAKEIYELGVYKFQQGNEDEALSKLSRAIEIDPTLSDAYEAKGVILGRQGKYEKAINLMDQLLESDPSSIMAHTNKSLYLMKLGKIKEAEDEKALATLKSFENFGKENENLKKQSELKKQEELERERKKSMFSQVLAIDENDEMANFGMAEIFFLTQKLDESKRHLEQILNYNDKYSQAYLLLGKIYIELNKLGPAKEILSKGVQVATKQGQMMPANQMQSLLMGIS